MRKKGKGEQEDSRKSLLKTEGIERQRKSERKLVRGTKKKRMLRKQVPCRQQGRSESSAAEHFDKSSSSGRTRTEVVFPRDEPDVI